MPMLMTERLERALRWAAECHAGHCRKGGNTPYVEHAFGVALVLERAGFDEDVVIAGLLHDAVEDTDATLEQVREKFGDRVAEIVALCTEKKRDDRGRTRPWRVRKEEYLDALAGAGHAGALGVALADKLHNLVSMLCDLRAGADLWSRFNATPGEADWYYTAAIDRFGRGDARLVRLAAECRAALDEVRRRSPPPPPPKIVEL